MMAASVLAGQQPSADGQDEGEIEIASSGISKDQYFKIFEFLRELQLDPTPDNYRMAWEYMLGGNNRLRVRLDEALTAHGRLSNDLVSDILTENDGVMSLEDLTGLVGEGEKLLAIGERALATSGKDSAAYAKALETRLDYIKGLDPSEQHDMPIEAQFKALLKITGQMLASTKKAKDTLAGSTEKIGAMRKRLDEANAMAQRDQLTGLPNRWAFEKQYAAATIRAKERFEPLTVAFIDIDHFKLVNDTHGHEAGDRVLQLVSEHLNTHANGNCHLARHGGEEFVVVFENHSCAEARGILDEAREALASRNLVNRETGQTIGQVTFSAGIADYDPRDGNRQVLRNADAALYAAKHGGRNQVRVHGQN